jgi:GTP-binding protein LepA
LPEPSRLDHVEEPLSKQRSSQIWLRRECNEFVYWKTWTDYEPDVFNYRACRVNLWHATSRNCIWFYDRLKTVSKGYASFDYTPIGMRTSSLWK